MEIDSDSEQSTTTKKQSEALKALTSGPLSSSTSKLSTCLRGIPSDEDFHFFYNFNEFKNPIKRIITNIESTLEAIGSTTNILGKKLIFPKNDVDEAYDWLVNLNDEVYERFDVSIDEFRKVRRMEEESGKRVGCVEDQDGFQLVQGKKKKGGRSNMSVDKNEGEKLGASSSSVKTVSRDSRTSGSKTRVPFHIPSITRPQTQFKILVNNSNEPFEHVWLEKSEDGSRFIHPLENFSELDFIDRNISDVEPVKPLPTESTPFKLIEEVRDLKDLAAKLRDVNEFAVDLEHNHYRSFQGLTCLMQISTRSEDFVVDTLKLHAHIGPHLREVFKDPSKKKVMHGADRDVLWFQRDFGIYICNLFDTGQASRVLKLERNSLEYLLHHFCGVTANKEYQSADWRLRPIPDEMLRYAREDTHYLLHIYDLIRVRLLEASTSSENADALLLEVYKRSYDICMQLYKKETLTATSYLNIYGLHEADFSSQQLAVVAGLCEWRDGVARAEDESTGFILPNRALLEIAKQMPLTAGKLRQLLRSNHLHIECNLGSIVSIVKRSIDNASAFEIVAEQLQKARKEMELAQPTVVADEDEASQAAENPAEVDAVSNNCIEDNSLSRIDMETANCTTTSACVKDEPMEVAGEGIESGTCGQAGQFKTAQNGHAVELPQKFVPSGLGQVSTEATVKVSKKPSGAFGALFGKSSSKRKLGTDPKVNVKVEQIKSSVTLPFHSFWGGSGQAEALPKERTIFSNQHPGESVSVVSDVTNLEDIIPLANDIDHQQESVDVLVANDCEKPSEQGSPTGVELNTGDKHMSLSELSSSFQDCLQSMNQKRGNGRVEKPREPESKVELKPFDYAAAREQIQFGENREDKETQSEEGHKNLLHSKERRKNSVSSRVPREEGAKDSQQARRRMAFPPTGNRSVTFR